jgi:hypothetical protein
MIASIRVALVAYSITISVGLVRVRDHRAIVARITNPISIHIIHWGRIARISNPITIAVRLVQVCYVRAIVQTTQHPVDFTRVAPGTITILVEAATNDGGKHCTFKQECYQHHLLPIGACLLCEHHRSWLVECWVRGW